MKFWQFHFFSNVIIFCVLWICWTFQNFSFFLHWPFWIKIFEHVSKKSFFRYIWRALCKKLFHLEKKIFVSVLPRNYDFSKFWTKKKVALFWSKNKNRQKFCSDHLIRRELGFVGNCFLSLGKIFNREKKRTKKMMFLGYSTLIG